jgi:colicin import membrane protein/SWI/SNF-related matrix-associated actin-dependent regulator 1 of chromatin subfamily A
MLFMGKRGQTAGTMSTKDARHLLGWRLKGAAERYHKRLRELEAKIEKQKGECSATYAKVKADLDAAIERERQAIADAKADKAKAVEKEAAHRARLAAARAEKKAKTKYQRDTCKLNAEKLREEKRAEREHHRENAALEKSLLKVQPKEERGLSLREQREQVEADVPEHLRPLWNKVRRSFKVSKRAEGRASLLEDFLNYAEQHPDAIAAAQEEELLREQARLEREQRRQQPRGQRSRGEAYVEGVPF